ncbi:TPA: DUF2969 domain-containing protein [Streptococcus suis]|uniref:DUF2969 domain-containing protein n=2 Tax=Streptococcus TaxID=1301 RepID=A0A4T2GP75_STRSU|nr:DUF2969 domain-containing protein [Streptococcus sp. 29896]MBL6537176.1 DUF2969 domain-containing protein [Streptococcus suis]MBM7268959.1 DUF2969 domain-containing protein [Streptococcus suis]MBM7269327.1 DUF2969 domain-containing protein [Streptococcus suis]MBM7314097.1 DUF2969 domain-containing protein [Streptococcus suis]MCK4027505.1 DUF2969 domain-containing protein [Streptococcus suis]
MAKKDKKIEIQIEDSKVSVNGQMFPGYQLTIGKKVIGEIAELEVNQFAVVKNGNTESFYKKLEKAVGNVIENYNLSN